MKSLKNLPLTLDALEATSPWLRYTSVFPPLPHPLVHGAAKALKQQEGRQVSSAVGEPPSLLCSVK
jgi:hypothetical protein